MPTKAEKKALWAAEKGEVMRVYSATGNVLRGPPGISSRTLWALDRQKWIRDGRGYGGTVFPQLLTPKGAAALSEDQANG